MISVEELKMFLCESYQNVEPDLVFQLAEELFELIENTELPLSDVVCYVDEFEQENDIDSCESKFSTIMDEVISLLDDNKTNANRLFTLVTDNFEWYSAVSKLIMYNMEYLSESQKEQLTSILESFDLKALLGDDYIYDYVYENLKRKTEM